MALVSVIIPCFNQGCLLPEAIGSLIAQSYSQWECIIVNDASTDDTETIAREWAAADNRIRFISSPANRGLAHSRNLGISQSSGVYILPLDADDRIAPAFLEKTVQALQHNPKAKVAYTDVQFFGARQGMARMEPLRFDRFFYTNQLVCTSLFRRDAFKETEGYRANMIHGLEDWDLWLQMLQSPEEAVHIPEPLFLYRQTNGSMWEALRADPQKEQAMLDQLVLNNPGFFKRVDPALFFSRWDRATGKRPGRLEQLRRWWYLRWIGFLNHRASEPRRITKL